MSCNDKDNDFAGTGKIVAGFIPILLPQRAEPGRRNGQFPRQAAEKSGVYI